MGIAAVVVIAATGGYFFYRGTKRVNSIASTAPHRRAVAVLGFKNLSGDPQKSWLSTALSEMLTTELGEGDQLRTIPGESVAQMKLSLALPDDDSFSKKTLGRIRQNLGSDDVVMGSYVVLGNGQLRLDLCLQDTKAGETLATVSEKGSEDQIDDLIGKAGAQLREKLGVDALSEAQSAVVRASLPSNPEAARLYSQGLQDLRLFNALAARDVLEKATALEPNFAPAHSDLAEAWASLGYDDKAKAQAKQALDLSAGSSREERLLIEGRSHELLHEWPKAIENYRALWEFFPDRVDYGLLLIRAQDAGGFVRDAESTLAQVRQLTVPEVDAARIDLMDANLGSGQGDLKRQKADGERAENEGRAIGANLVVAGALVLEGNAVERMGQPDEAIQYFRQAKDLYNLAGNRRGAASALLEEGDVLLDKGDFQNARKDFEGALAVYREIGAQRSIRNSLERIGNVLYSQGKPLESESYYNQVLQFDQTIHEPGALASDYGNIGNALEDLGDLKGALKMQQQSLAAFNEVSDKQNASETLFDLGNVATEMGDLGAANEYYDQALDIAKKISYRLGEPYAIAGKADILFIRGDLAGARKKYDEAAALAGEVKEEGIVTRVRISLIQVDLHEGKYSEGEKVSREIVAALEKGSGNSGNLGPVVAILARILLGEGKLAEAETMASKSIALSRPIVALSVHFDPILADALVKGKTGKYEEAREELESALSTARKHGYQPFEYDVRFALCEIEMWSGAASARAHLASLESDAKSHGYLLVANEALALAQSKQNKE